MPNDNAFISAGDAQPPFFAGIDLGGTNIKVGVVDDLGRPLIRMGIPTEPERGAEDAARRMGELVVEAVHRAKLDRTAIARVGLGSPGTMDIPAGRLVAPVNLKGWDDFPLRDRVAFWCGLPVTFQNDANAAAFGEYWVGRGRGLRSMVLLTLGTGIGCGIIVDGRILDGSHSHGGECGHIIIDSLPNARMCGCGRRGHLEAYASATAVVDRVRDQLETDRPSSIHRQLERECKLTPKLLAHEAEQGDALSMEIIQDTARYLGVGIASLMHTIDPDGVLLGGAMDFGGNETELGRQFLAWIREEVGRRAFPHLAERTLIEFATLGSDAGFIGAAGLARLEY